MKLHRLLLALSLMITLLVSAFENVPKSDSFSSQETKSEGCTSWWCSLWPNFFQQKANNVAQTLSVRDVQADLIDVWITMISSAKSDDVAQKNLAALLWELFPEESLNDIKLKKMLANAFKSTFHILPSNVALQVPRLLAMQNISKEAQNTLKGQLQVCNDNVTEQKRILDIIQQEYTTTTSKVDQLSHSMRQYHETKVHVDQLHGIYKNVLKQKGTFDEQKLAAINLRKVWTEHEKAIENLNNTFKVFNITNTIASDERFKRSLSTIFDLYEKYYEPNAEA